MKTRFITFGSHGVYVDAAARLIQQADNINVFTEIKLITSENLTSEPEFWNSHKEFVTANARGFGYWIWKPFIIKKSMDELENGDILLYLDAGSEINCKESGQMRMLFECVKTDKIIGSLTRIENDGEWNKMDLIESLDMNTDYYLNSRQRQGGVNMFLICPETRKLVNEWYEIACNYHLIDDSPSIIPNKKGFVEHRHDQSIFSLLTKKYNLYSSTPLEGSCIKCLRNLTGKSRLKC